MKVSSKCRICGTETENDAYEVREMFFGTGEKFIYFKCEVCQCLQTLEVPENLVKYYGNEYYSFSPLDISGDTIAEKIETRILDVGCGSGKWLAGKYLQGHVNLFGCDPFIEKDI